MSLVIMRHGGWLYIQFIPPNPLKGELILCNVELCAMKRKMFFDADPLLFERAKYLRNHLTDAEMKLWGFLRTNPIGYKFRRQHPIGIYIVDFYCHTIKLVIEADGNIHDQPDVQQSDKERQQSLESDGLQVIRFSNDDILKRTEFVIEQINNMLITKLTPLCADAEALAQESGGWGV